MVYNDFVGEDLFAFGESAGRMSAGFSVELGGSSSVLIVSLSALAV